MAKAKVKAKAKAKGKSPASGGLGSGNKLLLVVTAMAFVPFSLPTLLILFCCLLPTLVAAVAERGTGRYAWLCVGGLNFAGALPWLFDLWFGHHTLSYALDQLMGVTLLLVSYGCAGLGWALYLVMPPMILRIVGMTSARRSVRLIADQRKLVERWGDGVVSRLEE